MSDSNKLVARSMVIGTAGHIDHGKTTLVKALTGQDTDRLAEEKRRGISIDLGFAHKLLPNGLLLSFVDVPGHEHFVRNMLAGATGIEAALLVVAADEGVKPQTQEHFAICRLLGISSGLVVITKSDAAGAERIDVVSAQIRELCTGSFLEGRPSIPVSAQTGAGLDVLLKELQKLAASMAPVPSNGLARLPIDRSFTLTGFGTIVTGTLWNGELQVGDSVHVHPGPVSARVRGLQKHGKAVERAAPGERVAVNLSGIEHGQIARGAVLVHPDNFDPTFTIDASLEWLDRAAVPERRAQFLLHAGTAEIPVSLKIIESDGSLGRLWLSRSALLLPDDRFVLRRPSPASTVAGGTVLDAFPPQRLSRPKTKLRLKSLAEGTWPQRLQVLVDESIGGRRMSELGRRTGLSTNQLDAVVRHEKDLSVLPSANLVVSSRWLDAQRGKLLTWLQDFHQHHPELEGAPLVEALRCLESSSAKAILADSPGVRVSGDKVALRHHKPTVSADQSAFLQQLEFKFRQAGYQPPAPAEILRSIGADAAKVRGLLESLIRSNRLIRVNDDLIFHAEVVQHIRNALSAHKGRRFSIPEFKQWTQISRKYAIPLLEYLDRQRITRRDGDARVVL